MNEILNIITFFNTYMWYINKEILPSSIKNLTIFHWREPSSPVSKAWSLSRSILSFDVCQGNALSTTIFNLAAEPLPRAAKTRDFLCFETFGHELKVTAYADDLAVIPTQLAAGRRRDLLSDQVGPARWTTHANNTNTRQRKPIPILNRICFRT